MNKTPKPVTLQGHILVPLAELEIVQSAMAEHVRLSRAEAGCLKFEITQHSPDDKTRPDNMVRFNVTEAFTNQATFDHHQTRTSQSPWAKISKNVKRVYPSQ